MWLPACQVRGARAGREHSKQIERMRRQAMGTPPYKADGVVSAKINEVGGRQRRKAGNGKSVQPMRLPGLRDSEDPAKRKPSHSVGASGVGSSQPRRELLPESRPLGRRQCCPDRP